MVALSPLDYAVRALNGQSDRPPLVLRRHVGPLEGFEVSRGEWNAILRLKADLRPDDHFLDIACGCGSLAIELRHELTDGEYVGFDVHHASVAWARKHLGSDRVSFHHADLRTPYSPQGAVQPEAYRFPADDGWATLAAAKSIFTHLRAPVTLAYLSEISRVLAPGGRAILSFFLLEESDRNRRTLEFGYGDGPDRWLYAGRPEAGIAYEAAFVRDALAARGLTLNEVLEGRWRRPTGANYQDLLIVRK